ncbi:hypothetical protein HID58_040802, partial [Brassica napus]
MAVIGRVHELGDVQTVQVGGEDKKGFNFAWLTQSLGNNIACCLWENYAEQLEPFTEDKDQSIVCLIRFAKIKDFRGEVQITNAFHATRLYLNPMIPELTDLTERLSDDHLSVALVDKQDGKKDGKIIKYDWNDAEIKSIAEVNEANQVHIFKLHLVVKDDTGTCNLMLLGSVCQSIVGVKAEELWDGSYEEQLEPFTEDKDQSIVCLIRFAKIKDFRGEVQITNAFHATRLYLNPMIPELTDLTERLSDDHLSVALVDKQDGKKDGKRIKYDWNDAEIKSIAEVNEANQSIVGVKAEELWDGSYEEIEDPEILPEHILSLVGKSFCFGLYISSDNVTNGADTFVVLEVCSGDKVLSIENGSYSFSGMATTSSTMSSGSVLMLDQKSSEDCPTPITKRKMKRKKLEPITGVEPATEKTTTSLVKPQRHSSSSTIAFKEIPLCSIYYRLFENFENRQVPSNTTPYDQISMLSPQTPRNIRRCVLGIEDTDELQVFDCSSQDNTDTETEESDIDDPTDVDVELLVNVVTKKTGDSQRPDVTGTTVVNYTAKKKQDLKEN